jgi:hypothetical protein
MAAVRSASAAAASPVCSSRAAFLQPGQALGCSAKLREFEPLRLDRCRPLLQFVREQSADLLRLRRLVLSFRKRPEARHEDTPCTRQAGLVPHMPIELLLLLRLLRLPFSHTRIVGRKARMSPPPMSTARSLAAVRFSTRTPTPLHYHRPVVELPLTGGCMCGGVRFEVTEPLVSAGYCHCTRCQRRTGTAAAVSARVAPGSLRVLAGEELLRAYEPDGGFA